MSPKELTAFRLPPYLLDALREIKERDHISITDQVVRALEAWVESRGISRKTANRRASTRRKA